MKAYDIALITDSSCDLPDSLLSQHTIRFVPLYIIWGSQELRDRVDIQPAEFYQRLVTDPVHPKTSQPSPGDFLRAIEQARDEGAREAVIFTISSGMSSTYSSARQAALSAPIPTQVVDSKASSMTLGWQVLAAARARESGGSALDMMAAADRVRQRSVTLLYVDTLEYLHKGGRIGAAAKWIGTALNFKPQLYVDHNTGRIEPASRARTRSKGIESLYTDFIGKMNGSTLRVAVLHGNCQADADALAARFKREHSPAEMLVRITSPLTGVHTGPGALALCGYAE